MNARRNAKVLILMAVVAGTGLIWWLFAPEAPTSAPVATTSLVPIATVNPPVATAAAMSTPAAPVVQPGQMIPVPMAPKVVPAQNALSPSAKIQPVVAPATAAAARNAEVVATERMYLAHASLRDPEVADPDSGTNRRILQTMVTKTLQAPVATKP